MDEVIPYANRGEATVYEHLKRAIDFSMNHLGKHGMPAGLYAVVPEGGLTVRLWGLSEEIEAITAENLRATADMSAVTGQGSFTVPVTVTVSGFSDVTVRGTYELTLTITDTPPQTEPAVPAGGEDQTVPEVPET